MIIHDLVQGTPEWDAFRLNHHGASEAAVMLGLSTKVKRSELLRIKHTGIPKQFSDWVQANILDRGHEVEALATPIVEGIIGDDLYPVTCSEGILSASCDGLTLVGDTAFEHKQWAAELAESVRNGVLPEEHMPQCQQITLVTGAKRVIFTVSDGTSDKLVWMEVLPDPAWHQRIIAGWEQFDKDLAEYVLTDEPIKPVGVSPETLPALFIQVTGSVTASNIDAFKEHALTVFHGINRDLKTDQDFADAEKMVKWCGEVEDKLKAAKDHALSQTASIDALFKAIDDIVGTARSTRLELDKLVKAKKESIRDSIVAEGVAALRKHIGDLNESIGSPLMPNVSADFAAAIKGLRTLSSLKDAVATTLANAKIAANEIAGRIQVNLRAIEASGYLSLFPDVGQLVLKQSDDLTAIISTRIAQYQADEQLRQAQAETKIQQMHLQNEAALGSVRLLTDPVNLTEATQKPHVEGMPRADSGKLLKLGDINALLSPIEISSLGLQSLGFMPVAHDKAAKLYRESDVPLICRALIEHLGHVVSNMKAIS